MNLKYVVTTSAEKDGLIMQRIDDEFNAVRRTILQQVIDTTDQQVRSALQKLGWTSPEAMGAIDILQPGGGYRRITVAQVLQMERKLAAIEAALEL